MSAEDLPCLSAMGLSAMGLSAMGLSAMALQDLLGLSVLVRELRLVRVPCLDLTTAASSPTTPCAVAGQWVRPFRCRSTSKADSLFCLGVCRHVHTPGVGLIARGKQWVPAIQQLRHLGNNSDTDVAPAAFSRSSSPTSGVPSASPWRSRDTNLNCDELRSKPVSLVLPDPVRTRRSDRRVAPSDASPVGRSSRGPHSPASAARRRTLRLHRPRW